MDRGLFTPISVGVFIGLVIGKPLGVTLFSWLAVRLRLAELPEAVTWKQLVSSSFLTGIGFTMALFIASAAFNDPDMLDQAKLGIIFASLTAGITGYVLTLLTSPKMGQITQYETSPAMD